eukprot:gene1770-2439_t
MLQSWYCHCVERRKRRKLLRNIFMRIRHGIRDTAFSGWHAYLSQRVVKSTVRTRLLMQRRLTVAGRFIATWREEAAWRVARYHVACRAVEMVANTRGRQCLRQWQEVMVAWRRRRVITESAAARHVVRAMHEALQDWSHKAYWQRVHREGAERLEGLAEGHQKQLLEMMAKYAEGAREAQKAFEMEEARFDRFVELSRGRGMQMMADRRHTRLVLDALRAWGELLVEKAEFAASKADAEAETLQAIINGWNATVHKECETALLLDRFRLRWGRHLLQAALTGFVEVTGRQRLLRVAMAKVLSWTTKGIRGRILATWAQHASYVSRRRRTVAAAVRRLQRCVLRDMLKAWLMVTVDQSAYEETSAALMSQQREEVLATLFRDWRAHAEQQTWRASLLARGLNLGVARCLRAALWAWLQRTEAAAGKQLRLLRGTRASQRCLLRAVYRAWREAVAGDWLERNRQATIDTIGQVLERKSHEFGWDMARQAWDAWRTMIRFHQGLAAKAVRLLMRRRDRRAVVALGVWADAVAALRLVHEVAGRNRRVKALLAWREYLKERAAMEGVLRAHHGVVWRETCAQILGVWVDKAHARVTSRRRVVLIRDRKQQRMLVLSFGLWAGLTEERHQKCELGELELDLTVRHDQEVSDLMAFHAAQVAETKRDVEEKYETLKWDRYSLEVMVNDEIEKAQRDYKLLIRLNELRFIKRHEHRFKRDVWRAWVEMRTFLRLFTRGLAKSAAHRVHALQSAVLRWWGEWAAERASCAKCMAAVLRDRLARRAFSMLLLWEEEVGAARLQRHRVLRMVMWRKAGFLAAWRSVVVVIVTRRHSGGCLYRRVLWRHMIELLEEWRGEAAGLAEARRRAEGLAMLESQHQTQLTNLMAEHSDALDLKRVELEEKAKERTSLEEFMQHEIHLRAEALAAQHLTLAGHLEARYERSLLRGSLREWSAVLHLAHCGAELHSRLRSRLAGGVLGCWRAEVEAQVRTKDKALRMAVLRARQMAREHLARWEVAANRLVIRKQLGERGVLRVTQILGRACLQRWRLYTESQRMLQERLHASTLRSHFWALQTVLHDWKQWADNEKMMRGQQEELMSTEVNYQMEISGEEVRHRGEVEDMAERMRNKEIEWWQEKMLLEMDKVHLKESVDYEKTNHRKHMQKRARVHALHMAWDSWMEGFARRAHYRHLAAVLCANITRERLAGAVAVWWMYRSREKSRRELQAIINQQRTLKTVSVCMTVWMNTSLAMAVRRALVARGMARTRLRTLQRALHAWAQVALFAGNVTRRIRRQLSKLRAHHVREALLGWEEVAKHEVEIRARQEEERRVQADHAEEIQEMHEAAERREMQHMDALDLKDIDMFSQEMMMQVEVDRRRRNQMYTIRMQMLHKGERREAMLRRKVLAVWRELRAWRLSSEHTLDVFALAVRMRLTRTILQAWRGLRLRRHTLQHMHATCSGQHRQRALQHALASWEVFAQEEGQLSRKRLRLAAVLTRALLRRTLVVWEEHAWAAHVRKARVVALLRRGATWTARGALEAWSEATTIAREARWFDQRVARAVALFAGRQATAAYTHWALLVTTRRVEAHRVRTLRAAISRRTRAEVLVAWERHMTAWRAAQRHEDWSLLRRHMLSWQEGMADQKSYRILMRQQLQKNYFETMSQVFTVWAQVWNVSAGYRRLLQRHWNYGLRFLQSEVIKAWSEFTLREEAGRRLLERGLLRTFRHSAARVLQGWEQETVNAIEARRAEATLLQTLDDRLQQEQEVEMKHQGDINAVRTQAESDLYCQYSKEVMLLDAVQTEHSKAKMRLRSLERHFASRRRMAMIVMVLEWWSHVSADQISRRRRIARLVARRVKVSRQTVFTSWAATTATMRVTARHTSKVAHRVVRDAFWQWHLGLEVAEGKARAADAAQHWLYLRTGRLAVEAWVEAVAELKAERLEARRAEAIRHTVERGAGEADALMLSRILLVWLQHTRESRTRLQRSQHLARRRVVLAWTKKKQLMQHHERTWNRTMCSVMGVWWDMAELMLRMRRLLKRGIKRQSVRYKSWVVAEWVAAAAQQKRERRREEEHMDEVVDHEEELARILAEHREEIQSYRGQLSDMEVTHYSQETMLEMEMERVRLSRRNLMKNHLGHLRKRLDLQRQHFVLTEWLACAVSHRREKAIVVRQLGKRRLSILQMCLLSWEQHRAEARARVLQHAFLNRHHLVSLKRSVWADWIARVRLQKRRLWAVKEVVARMRGKDAATTFGWWTLWASQEKHRRCAVNRKRRSTLQYMLQNWFLLAAWGQQEQQTTAETQMQEAEHQLEISQLLEKHKQDMAEMYEKLDVMTVDHYSQETMINIETERLSKIMSLSIRRQSRNLNIRSYCRNRRKSFNQWTQWASSKFWCRLMVVKLRLGYLERRQASVLSEWNQWSSEKAGAKSLIGRCRANWALRTLHGCLFGWQAVLMSLQRIKNVITRAMERSKRMSMRISFDVWTEETYFLQWRKQREALKQTIHNFVERSFSGKCQTFAWDAFNVWSAITKHWRADRLRVAVMLRRSNHALLHLCVEEWLRIQSFQKLARKHHLFCARRRVFNGWLHGCRSSIWALQEHRIRSRRESRILKAVMAMWTELGARCTRNMRLYVRALHRISGGHARRVLLVWRHVATEEREERVKEQKMTILEMEHQEEIAKEVRAFQDEIAVLRGTVEMKEVDKFSTETVLTELNDSMRAHVMFVRQKFQLYLVLRQQWRLVREAIMAWMLYTMMGQRRRHEVVVFAQRWRRHVKQLVLDRWQARVRGRGLWTCNVFAAVTRLRRFKHLRQLTHAWKLLSDFKLARLRMVEAHFVLVCTRSYLRLWSRVTREALMEAPKKKYAATLKAFVASKVRRLLVNACKVTLERWHFYCILNHEKKLKCIRSLAKHNYRGAKEVFQAWLEALHMSIAIDELVYGRHIKKSFRAWCEACDAKREHTRLLHQHMSILWGSIMQEVMLRWTQMVMHERVRKQLFVRASLRVHNHLKLKVLQVWVLFMEDLAAAEDAELTEQEQLEAMEKRTATVALHLEGHLLRQKFYKLRKLIEAWHAEVLYATHLRWTVALPLMRRLRSLAMSALGGWLLFTRSKRSTLQVMYRLADVTQHRMGRRALLAWVAFRDSCFNAYRLQLRIWDKACSTLQRAIFRDWFMVSHDRQMQMELERAALEYELDHQQELATLQEANQVVVKDSDAKVVVEHANMQIALGEVDRLNELYVRHITQCCHAITKRSAGRLIKAGFYGWSEEIAKKRRDRHVLTLHLDCVAVELARAVLVAWADLLEHRMQAMLKSSVLLQRLQRGHLARGFQALAEHAELCHRREACARRAIARLQSQRRAAAIVRWAEAAQNRSVLRKVASRALHRMRHRQLCAAFTKWEEKVAATEQANLMRVALLETDLKQVTEEVTAYAQVQISDYEERCKHQLALMEQQLLEHQHQSELLDFEVRRREHNKVVVQATHLARMLVQWSRRIVQKAFTQWARCAEKLVHAVHEADLIFSQRAQEILQNAMGTWLYVMSRNATLDLQFGRIFTRHLRRTARDTLFEWLHLTVHAKILRHQVARSELRLW